MWENAGKLSVPFRGKQGNAAHSFAFKSRNVQESMRDQDAALKISGMYVAEQDGERNSRIMKEAGKNLMWKHEGTARRRRI